MRKELDDLLCKRYPAIFAERNMPMNQTCMCWGFEHGDGWFAIIDRLCSTIQQHLAQNPTVPPVVAKQVKEKFGGLRFYFEGGDDFVDGAAHLAEALSYRTCEECGSTTDVGQTHSTWVYTRCRACAAKLRPEHATAWKSGEEAEAVEKEVKED